MHSITLATAVLMATAAYCSALAETAPASISGPWKIESQNGPVPLCGFEQAGNTISGSCTGPNAKGIITGTIIGDQVRWSWLWVTYAGNSERSAGTFVFTGTLRPDNSITGIVGRLETGSSLNFTAKKQQPQWTEAMQQGWDRRNTPVTPKSDQVQQQPPLTAKGREIAAADRAFANRPGEEAFDRDLVVRANSLFGSFGTQEQMRLRDEWLTAQQQARARNQIEMMKAGHDYTVEWRNR